MGHVNTIASSQDDEPLSWRNGRPAVLYFAVVKRLSMCGLLLMICALSLSGCVDTPEVQQSNYLAADFFGTWDTTLPNGEKWQLVLHADGHFDSLPLNSPRAAVSGTWEVQEGRFLWQYHDPTSPDGAIWREINPVIMKTANKFMLQERLGLKSVYSRHDG